MAPLPVSAAVTARGLFDYRHGFDLDDTELRAGPILDCAAGASPFAAQARARGATVTSVNPLYDQVTAEIVGGSRPTWPAPPAGSPPTVTTSTGATSARPTRTSEPPRLLRTSSLPTSPTTPSITSLPPYPNFRFPTGTSG